MARGPRGQVAAAALAVLALAVGFRLASRTDPPAPNSPGTFSFGALGDAPYYVWEELQFRSVLEQLDAHDLSWVLHVGDIFWRPCTDELYRRSLGWLGGLRHAVVYTPGDNEWRDCWEAGSGGFQPLERLERLRRLFFPDPAATLGRGRLAVVRQGGREPFPEFVENARWTRAGIVFATLHLLGALGDEAPPALRAAGVGQARRRSEAAAAWLRESFAAARASGSSAVVLAFHVNPSFEAAASDPHRQTLEPFLTALEEEVEAFPGPVLAVHGDDHVYTVDQPLVRRSTGRRLLNLTRLQVPGSPDVGWVRVTVTPGAESPFAFQAHVVPRWKYW